MEDPATGETKWVDTTVVHTAAESYREREFKSVMARNVSTSTAAALASTDVLKFQASPIVLERSTAKSHKPEPWPPDPPDPTLQTSKSSTVFPSNPAQLSILFPDYLLILASEVQLWNYVPKSLLVSTGDGHGGSHWLAIADQTWITRS